MSKEKALLKEILANTKAIMDHLKINNTVSHNRPAGKTSGTTKSSPGKKTPVKKSK